MFKKESEHSSYKCNCDKKYNFYEIFSPMSFYDAFE